MNKKKWKNYLKKCVKYLRFLKNYVIINEMFYSKCGVEINMNTNYDEFINITYDILDNREFNKLKDVVHHGMNRYDHSFRVAIVSYSITKFLNLDYTKTARAALLHDFFLEENVGESLSTRIKTLVKHPMYAVENSSKYFNLSDLEKDIITTHMFPISFKIPKYLESWIVDLVDDGISIYERLFGIRKQLSFATSFMFILFMNRFK